MIREFNESIKKYFQGIGKNVENRQLKDFFVFLKEYFRTNPSEVIDNLLISIEYYRNSNNPLDFGISHFIHNFQKTLFEIRSKCEENKLKNILFEKVMDDLMELIPEKKWGKKINENFFNYLPYKPAKNICHADGNIVSSGDLLEKILENSDGIAKIKNADRKAYGVEEEAGGVGEELNNTNIPWLDIRVVMDLSDPHSRNPKYKDRNKQQASEIAGKYCIEFIRWYFRRSLQENGKILAKRLKSELKQDDYLSKFNEFKFENILYSREVKPFRPDGPKIIDFEKEEWVYIPKSFINFNFNKIAILGGYSGTGKSVIARYIGYYSMHLRNKSVYYIDFLELNKNDKDNLVENIDSIIINPLFKQATNIFRNILFIFENIHDPEINKINFLRKLKTLTKRINVLLTTRESKINEIYYYDWVLFKDIFSLLFDFAIKKSGDFESLVVSDDLLFSPVSFKYKMEKKVKLKKSGTM